jgi:broad specificity phosphatase PhoE
MIDRTEEYKTKRKKRRIRRVIVALVFIAFATLLSWFFESQSTTTVVLTTHAEIDSSKGINPGNPGLSQLGLERANSLQEIIESIDVVAGVDAIYATQLRATQETALPLSKSLSLPMTLIDATDVEGLIKAIMDKHKGKIILIVTHPDTLPKLVVELQGSKKIEPITLTENNKIFIVSVPWFGKVKTLQLKYGV